MFSYVTLAADGGFTMILLSMESQFSWQALVCSKCLITCMLFLYNYAVLLWYHVIHETSCIIAITIAYTTFPMILNDYQKAIIM